MSGVKVDLNPHQVDAALFALKSPLRNGALLADEVGLGKTIEAGIVLAQLWSERKRHILLIVPASLRMQWRAELSEKFFIDSVIMESATYNKYLKTGNTNPFNVKDKVVICSYNFASRKEGARIDFRFGDAEGILDELVEDLSDADDSEKFDFVFIDAAKSHYREFFEAAEKICTGNALIVCDNILLNGWILEADGKDAKRHRTSIKYMKKFLEYLRQRDDLEVTILTGADGLAIIRFINEKQR